MTAAAAVPGHLPAPGTEDRWLAENPWWTDAPEPPAAWLAEDPGLAEDPWWTEEPEPPATRPAEHASLAEDPGLADGGEPAQAWPTEDPWLAEDPWLDEDPEWAEGPWLDEDPWLAEDQASSQRPGPVEVFKAGRWDRSRGDGGGFAAGGAADDLPPGPVLAGLAGDRWADGLGRLSDDELIVAT